MRPLASAARASSSWKPFTTSTSASMPSGGVPTLLPRPSMTSPPGNGETSSALSRPRTQCGTFTGSRRTFSRPSFFISSAAQRMAASSDSDPESRWPKVSVISRRRSQALPSARAAVKTREAASR
jgi:hypothetical protein